MTLSRRVSLVEAMQHTSAMVLAPLTKVIRRLALLVWMKVDVKDEKMVVWKVFLTVEMSVVMTVVMMVVM